MDKLNKQKEIPLTFWYNGVIETTLTAKKGGISMLKEKDNQLSIYSILYNKIPIVVLADDKLRMGNDASK
ncbi:hypothetical protein [Ornithinibacillus halotolerans]|uniref:Uncharacterized protein n=1 Tax=Ornithinibacillus halotolerans TaxID=1274357 RepID=A0A916S9C8_9BACI|nr:hypothetical protein [Ornithinibacillus halotolerans]GGA87191.1 hypothetical protein GCM10008025_32550 [Ornithinibacillus halotolerans]